MNRAVSAEGLVLFVNDKREMLGHFLATLACRVTKALRGAPPDFPAFRAATADSAGELRPWQRSGPTMSDWTNPNQ